MIYILGLKKLQSVNYPVMKNAQELVIDPQWNMRVIFSPMLYIVKNGLTTFYSFINFYSFEFNYFL